MAFFAASTWAIGMAAVSAYSAYSSAEQANNQAEQAANNANRKYALNASQSKNQMNQQKQLATSKMTEVSKAFLKARGTDTALQAETMVGGNLQKRLKFNTATQFTNAKDKVGSEIETNIMNIANGLLVDKINTEGAIADANARRQNVAMNTIIGGVQGAAQGYQLGTATSKTKTDTSTIK